MIDLIQILKVATRFLAHKSQRGDQELDTKAIYFATINRSTLIKS